MTSQELQGRADLVEIVVWDTVRLNDKPQDEYKVKSKIAEGDPSKITCFSFSWGNYRREGFLGIAMPQSI